MNMIKQLSYYMTHTFTDRIINIDNLSNVFIKWLFMRIYKFRDLQVFIT